MFLSAADVEILPDGWEQTVSYTLTVHGAAKSDDENEATINDRSVRHSFDKITFNASDLSWGHPQFVPLADMIDPTKALVSRNNEVVITADVLVPSTASIELTCVKAAKVGNVEVLRFAHENDAAWDEETCAAAAAGGHLEALRWAHENGCPWDERTCKNAAEGGHIEALKYARANGCPWGEWTMSWAVGNGHREMQELYNEELKQRHQAIPGIFNEIVIEHVLKSDHIPDFADLKRLREVSPAMRDAVNVTRRLEQHAAEIS